MVEGQLRQKEYYDLHRKPDLNRQSGDMVRFLRRNIKTTRPSKKLDFTKIPRFKILAKIGTGAYKLVILPSMVIQNRFHIFLLERYQDNGFPTQIKEPPPPIQIEGEDEFKLDGIIDSRLHYKNLQYRANWTGYLPEHDKVWYHAQNLNNAEHTVHQFHQRYPRKPGVDARYAQQMVLRTFPGRQRSPTITSTRERRPARGPQHYPH